MVDAITKFITDYPTLIEVCAFALGLGESLILLSFFVPSTAIFLVVGAFLGATGQMLWPVVLAAALGSFVGDLISYTFGYRYRDQVASSWPFRDNPEWLPRSRAFVRQWGMLSVVFGKFVGPLRPVVPVVCGVSRMKSVTFAPAAAAASLLWAAAFLVPPYYGLSWLSR